MIFYLSDLDVCQGTFVGELMIFICRVLLMCLVAVCLPAVHVGALEVHVELSTVSSL